MITLSARWRGTHQLRWWPAVQNSESKCKQETQTKGQERKPACSKFYTLNCSSTGPSGCYSRISVISGAITVLRPLDRLPIKEAVIRKCLSYEQVKPNNQITQDVCSTNVFNFSGSVKCRLLHKSISSTHTRTPTRTPDYLSNCRRSPKTDQRTFRPEVLNGANNEILKQINFPKPSQMTTGFARDLASGSIGQTATDSWRVAADRLKGA